MKKKKNFFIILLFSNFLLLLLLFQNFVDCDCTGEIAEDGIIDYIYQEQAYWVANEDGPWERAWLAKYEMSNMMSMFGLVMALISISVVKRLDILIIV